MVEGGNSVLFQPDANSIFMNIQLAHFVGRILCLASMDYALYSVPCFQAVLSS